MTAHCSTCQCADDGVPQPAISSPGIRALAKQATAEAVRKSKDARKPAEIRNATEESTP